MLGFVQARMGSTRLPGKSMADVGGWPVLRWVCARLGKSRRIRKIVVLIPDLAQDDCLERLAEEMGVACFRGPETDVLARFAGAARRWPEEWILRVTADCPFVDPEIVDAVHDLACAGGLDYASNVLGRRYPRGLDCEVMRRGALLEMAGVATAAAQREHVTPGFYTPPLCGAFRSGGLSWPEDASRHHWCIDTAGDLAFARRVAALADAELLPGGRFFGWRALLDLLEARPHSAWYGEGK